MSKGNEMVRLRVPQEQLEEWRRRAKAAGLELGDWMRAELPGAVAKAPVRREESAPERRAAPPVEEEPRMVVRCAVRVCTKGGPTPRWRCPDHPLQVPVPVPVRR